MRILQLCNKMPWPAKDGYAIAVLNLSNAFADAGEQVSILAMNTTKHFVDPKKIPADLQRKLNLSFVPVDNSVRASGALSSLLWNRSYHLQRFISADFSNALEKLLKQNKYDIIQLEGLYLCPYIELIRKHSKAKIVLRAHNVEHVLWERNASREKSFLKRAYMTILARQLKEYEISVLNAFDALVPVSEPDAKVFAELGCTAPVHVCPVSFDNNMLNEKKETAEKDSLFFIGSLDWQPNIEGLEWFSEKVWDRIHAKHPALKFYIAGRNGGERIAKLKSENVTLMGEVEDAHALMRSKEVMLVPLFSGSGMRVKIIEAMALGKIIVSTSIGAEGIVCTNGENILIADTESEWMAQISWIMENPASALNLGKKAAQFAQTYYGAATTAQALLSFYKNEIK